MKRLFLAAFLPALALTLVNAIEPPQLDDAFLYEVAEQIVESPLDPYGFDIHWIQWPQPVHEELTAPIVPYWWALALALFPDGPVLWKLSLFPFALLLTAASVALAERFAPATRRAAPWAIALAPAVLTGLNLSQDVPALALGAAALALYLSASDRGSWSLAAAAGLLGGLALQTKYTAIGAIGAMALHALLSRRYRAAALALPLSFALFAAWELYTTARYGAGMFAGQLEQSLFWVPRRAIVLPLLQAWGGTSLGLVPAALALVGAGSRVVWGSALGALAAAGAMLAYGFETELYAMLGLCSLIAIVVAARRCRGDRATLFLLLWLAGEIIVSFAAAPFPAVRRILVPSCVAWLLVARGWDAARPSRAAAGAVLFAIALPALVMQGVDTLGSRAERAAVRWSEARLDALAPTGRGQVWFVGHWGVQFHATRRGWRPLDPDHVELQPGDWIVRASGVDAQQVRLPPGDVRLQARAAWDARLPLVTGQGFYGGGKPLSRSGQRVAVELLRVERPFVPESDWTTRRLADWARRAVGRSAAAAGAALARDLTRGSADQRRWAVVGLASLGPRAAPWLPELLVAAGDPDAEVRLGVAEALGQLLDEPAARAALESLAADVDPGVAGRARALLTLRSVASPE